MRDGVTSSLSSLVAPSSSSVSHRTPCYECGRVSDVLCSDCDTSFCQPCAHKVHSSKALGKHTLVSFPRRTPCFECAEAADVQCQDCSEAFCHRCSLKVHSSKVLAAHCIVTLSASRQQAIVSVNASLIDNSDMGLEPDVVEDVEGSSSPPKSLACTRSRALAGLVLSMAIVGVIVLFETGLLNRTRRVCVVEHEGKKLTACIFCQGLGDVGGSQWWVGRNARSHPASRLCCSLLIFSITCDCGCECFGCGGGHL
jgi:hypothetical protein